MFYIKNEQVVDGKIDHIDIGDHTEINCYECTDLKELPLWPFVTHVDCSNCPLLKELPLWPNVEIVYCYDCPLLRY